ncbi:endonuclease/exonuclease/phosphatase family metal-dependent hydrolase [Algoriphagus ratkowskyi]|uniref:Endonuclease/exonuclease/phosphatase family metal-dependent hydrolase n=1 Tax=Algoriphagus ratkowskyi TaxID=57028 RepID=A0A2W7QV71_9BACT|nr:endonuclease/exonuclease/phosphatase family protein [Algoriphagus ratkowskyi]PZX51881.1 endonuclease/exonuclease/phosphatase family metal-dependent hydrolase [Algoriphagus ratkowskyi]TXD75990.1 endonuclease/exonuclease/phosphatase family protein [Algoriphagus ratkowskyi]
MLTIARHLLKSFAFLLIFVVGITFHSSAQTHNFATFNIRYANQNDVGNLWADRLSHVSSLIQFHQIELFGVQEALHNQLTDLSTELGYKYIGVGRDDGTEKGEYAAILYNPKKFEILDQGTFWLSPTPEKPSKGWDAALNRVCTWGKFKDESGKSFFVFNIHYDHIGQQAREESSKLVMAQVAKINKENAPAILMGDFNVKPDNAAYTTITSDPDWKDARLISEIPAYGPAGTFTGFDWERMPEGIIDHVFVKGDIKVIRHGILTDNYGKKYPSDHFPVLVEVEF